MDAISAAFIALPPVAIHETPLPEISPSDLDAFLAFVDDDCDGNLRDHRVLARFLPFQFSFDTKVDQSLDPFGNAYFQSQLDLYEEIARRKLDQWSGELHPVDIDALLDSPNPQGINDVGHVSENVRAVSSMLSIADLKGNAHILDMGAGHGTSSEIYAFCGARVHAVDIDAKLSQLALLRAARRSLKVTRSVLNFDSLEALENDSYDAAFFFQSLHHALRPWELIADLKRKLTRQGVIGFCGEPIQDERWTHWGLRLDIESVYVARKYGWFESGWSRQFIAECFARNGMTLTLFEGGHEGGLIGLAAVADAETYAIRSRAAKLGHAVSDSAEGAAVATKCHSQIGTLSTRSSLGPFMKAHAGHQPGFLCFGPYIPLNAGQYEVTFVLTCLEAGTDQETAGGSVVFDIVSGAGTATHLKEHIRLSPGEGSRSVRYQFVLDADVVQAETRVYVAQPNEVWEMSLPNLKRRL